MTLSHKKTLLKINIYIISNNTKKKNIMKTHSKFLLITFLTSIISFQFQNRKLSEIEKNEISKIFNSMISSPTKPLPTLLQNCEKFQAAKVQKSSERIAKQRKNLRTPN